MARIVYFAFPNGQLSGGQKMILRHVETLRELGFDAVCWQGPANSMPDWMDHKAPVLVGAPLRPDDILVVPSDAPNGLRQVAAMPQRSLVFCQNQFTFASLSFEAMDAFDPARFPTFIGVGPSVEAWVRRAFPQAVVETIPCFADERIFHPRGERRRAIAFSPRKRPLEAAAIRHFFRRVHPDYAKIPWHELHDAREPQVAEAFAASTLFLSLSRLEAVGMTPLEAMASGCICAGFTGLGGWDFATSENGFWVPEDDVEAAADALAQAIELVAGGGPALQRMQEAGFATAARWSYAVFRERLEEVWTRLAPEARVLA